MNKAKITLEHVSYIYSKGTPFEIKALDDVCLDIHEGTITGIIGHTGSGKSTMVQLFNGLTKPMEGRILLDGKDIWEKPKEISKIRYIVGMVMQYPEYQLFADTVWDDIAYGPRNMKVSEDEVRERVERSAYFCGISKETLEKSPFDLSGGQKRRVAIAGVIAMRPEMLILDEPTAGLDPAGKKDILNLVKKLQSECSPTIVMISHNMDEISDLADKIVLMHKGELLACMPPEELFTCEELVIKAGLELPVSVSVANKLIQKGISLDKIPCRKSELASILLAKGGKDVK